MNGDALDVLRAALHEIDERADLMLDGYLADDGNNVVSRDITTLRDIARVALTRAETVTTSLQNKLTLTRGAVRFLDCMIRSGESHSEYSLKVVRAALARTPAENAK
jgi:hypothetical protein